MCEFICVCVSEWRIGVRVCVSVCLRLMPGCTLVFFSLVTQHSSKPRPTSTTTLPEWVWSPPDLPSKTHNTHTKLSRSGGEDMQTFEEWPIFNDSQAKMITIWCQYMLLAEIGPFLDPLIVLLLRNTMSTGISLFWPWRSWGKMIMQACNTLMHRP